ncbi:hypothetical protein NQ317_015531 [Molorchus minor]|uniref:DUF4806 domain-containing protein n=1 Tax=Molorchus minor TaxID=1323400 RepID=A0ABQ9JBC8_9CUCU|nr:hypothetical protein NQ317_015531 [Molorchus minor]
MWSARTVQRGGRRDGLAVNLPLAYESISSYARFLSVSPTIQVLQQANFRDKVIKVIDVSNLYESGQARNKIKLSATGCNEESKESNVILLKNFIKQSKGFQKEVIEYLKRIDSNINRNVKVSSILHGSSLISTVEECKLDPILRLLPCKNMEDFQVLERFLAEDDEQLLSFAQELSRKGGETAKEILKNMLTYTISNQLGTLFSWEGHKGKYVFKTLNIANVLIKAVRLNARTSSVQEDEIIKCIKSWLVKCRDRIISSKKTTAEEISIDKSFLL